MWPFILKFNVDLLHVFAAWRRLTRNTDWLLDNFLFEKDKMKPKTSFANGQFYAKGTTKNTLYKMSIMILTDGKSHSFDKKLLTKVDVKHLKAFHLLQCYSGNVTVNCVCLEKSILCWFCKLKQKLRLLNNVVSIETLWDV